MLKLPSVLRDGCRLHALCYALVSPLAKEGLFFPEAIPGLRPCWVKHPCVYAAGSFPSVLACELLGQQECLTQCSVFQEGLVASPVQRAGEPVPRIGCAGPVAAAEAAALAKRAGR